MAQTAFADAFIKAGVDTTPSQLFTKATSALSDWPNNFEKALDNFCLDVSPAETRELCRLYLLDRQTDMRNGVEPPKRDEAGPMIVASQANVRMPRLVSPPRGLKAIASVQPAIAQSIFQTTRLPDGRSLAQVQWHELPKLAGEYRQHSRMLMLIHRKAIPPDAFMTVDQVVKEADVKEAIRQAEQANDIY